MNAGMYHETARPSVAMSKTGAVSFTRDATCPGNFGLVPERLYSGAMARSQM